MKVQFTPSAPEIEDGTYTAIPYSIIYLGTQMYQGEAQKSERFNLTFELPDVKAIFDGVEKPRVKSTELGMSYGEKSKLPGAMQSILGKKMTEEEMRDFDLDGLLGNPCMIELATNDKGFQGIKSINKLMKGLNVPKQFNPNSILGYEENAWNKAKYDKLPEFMKNKIKQAPQYARCLGLAVETSGFAHVETKDEEVPF